MRSEWTKEFWRKLNADPMAKAIYTEKKIAGIKAGFLHRREQGLFGSKGHYKRGNKCAVL
jgi:hypothetical protein